MREDLLLVPLPKSPFSRRATDSARRAAARAMPAPVIPPPTMAMSNLSRWKRWMLLARVCREKRPRGGESLGTRRPFVHGGELAGVHDVLGVEGLLEGGQGAGAARPQVGGHPGPVVAADAVVVAQSGAVVNDGLGGDGLRSLPLLDLPTLLL